MDKNVTIRVRTDFSLRKDQKSPAHLIKIFVYYFQRIITTRYVVSMVRIADGKITNVFFVCSSPRIAFEITSTTVCRARVDRRNVQRNAM